MSENGNMPLNIGFGDHSVPAFYPQDVVTIVQVEIDLELDKMALQIADDLPCAYAILHIGFEDFYNFHVALLYQGSREILKFK